MNRFTALADEHTASVREIQRNPSRALRGITRVMNGSKTVGFYLSTEHFEELVENNEAMASQSYVANIAQGRRDLKAGKGKGLTTLGAKYGL